LIRNFLVNSEHTGRHIVFSMRTGRKYYIEPIGEVRSGWGDIDPATKKTTGSYGKKYKGSVSEKESLITEENGFKNIQLVERGSPYELIEAMDAKYPDKE